MNRKHVTGIALLLALAVVAGLIAVVRTTGLAASGNRSATEALVQARTKQLNAVEASLRSQVKALDRAAATTPTSTSATTATAAAGDQRVVYVRPAPIVRTIHRANGEDGEREGNDD